MISWLGSHIHPVYEDAMEDYKKVRECVDSLIGTGDTYFNSLGRADGSYLC